MTTHKTNPTYSSWEEESRGDFEPKGGSLGLVGGIIERFVM
jgi:hypothetical protein